MNSESQILNWLMIGMSQSPNSLNEIFYFDKLHNEFFSILAIDYFMLDENFDVAENVSTSYSQSNENGVVDKIKRIESEDKHIILVPRLSKKERDDILTEFLQSINNPEEKERIENLYLKTEGRTIFYKEFAIESEVEIVDKWNDFKNEILLSNAESFLSLHNINVHSARVWDLEEVGSIKVDLTKDDSGNVIEEEKSGRKPGNIKNR